MTKSEIKAELREAALSGLDPFWTAHLDAVNLADEWFVETDPVWGNDDIDSWFLLFVAEAL